MLDDLPSLSLGSRVMLKFPECCRWGGDNSHIYFSHGPDFLPSVVKRHFRVFNVTRVTGPQKCSTALTLAPAIQLVFEDGQGSNIPILYGPMSFKHCKRDQGDLIARIIAEVISPSALNLVRVGLMIWDARTGATTACLSVSREPPSGFPCTPF